MTEQEKKDIKEIFEELNKSPLYNLSMCSLENFHTNFLVWLGKTYPQQTLELLAECIKDNQRTIIKKWENIEFVTQENLGKDCKFDLCVKSKANAEDSKILLVLENKIKSYPTEEQLEKYNEELKNKEHKPVKILLTLLPCDLEDYKSWQHITYSSFKFNDIFSDEFWKNQVENINKDEIEDEIKDEISYNKSLISDYSKLIENLDLAIKNVENRTNKPQELNSLLYENINSFAEELKNIKFDNAYKKYKTGELTNYIKNHIPNEINVENIKFSTDFSQQNEGVINIEKSYFIPPNSSSNKKPKPDFILSIQIQGNEYRRCLVYGTKEQKENRFNFAQRLKKLGIWFSDGDLETNSKKSSYTDECIKNDEEILYRGYSPDRIFRHFDMAKKELNTYKSIAEQVKSDIEHLNDNDNKTKIQKAYNDFLNGKSTTSDKT